MNEIENNFEKINNNNIGNYDNNIDNNNMRIIQLEKDNNLLVERNKLLEERLQNLEQFIASNISNTSNNSNLNNVPSNHNSYILDQNKPQSINNNINNNYNINNSVINDASLLGINQKPSSDININTSEKIIHKKVVKKNSARNKTPHINNINNNNNSNRKKNPSSKKTYINNPRQSSSRIRKSLNKSTSKTNNNSKAYSIRTSLKRSATNTSFNISKRSSKTFKSAVQSVILPSSMIKKSDKIKFKTNREKDEYDLSKINEMIEEKRKEIESLEYELNLQDISKKGEGYLKYELDLWQNKTNTLSTVFYQMFNNIKSEAYLDKNEFQSLIHNMKTFCENNQNFEENICENLINKQKWFIKNYEKQNAEMKKKLKKIKNVFK